MKVALCPIENSPREGESLLAIEDALRAASSGEADLALFPECALTGFSPRKDLDESSCETLIGKASAIVAKHGVLTLLPSIVVTPAGARRSCAILISPRGKELQRFHKAGLTEAELQYFSPGEPGPREFEVSGTRVACVFCREIEDAPQQYFPSTPEVILWPGYWGWGHPWNPVQEGERNPALFSNLRTWGVPVLQANFTGSPAEPEGALGLGGSAVFDARGKLVELTPRDRVAPLLVDTRSIR